MSGTSSAAACVKSALALVGSTAFTVFRPFAYVVRTVARSVVLVVVISIYAFGAAIALGFGLLARTVATVFTAVRIAVFSAARPFQRSAIAAVGILAAAIGLARYEIAGLVGLCKAALLFAAQIIGNGLGLVLAPIWFVIKTTATQLGLAVTSLKTMATRLGLAATSLMEYLKRVVTLAALAIGRLLWSGGRKATAWC